MHRAVTGNKDKILKHLKELSKVNLPAILKNKDLQWEAKTAKQNDQMFNKKFVIILTDTSYSTSEPLTAHSFGFTKVNVDADNMFWNDYTLWQSRKVESSLFSPQQCMKHPRQKSWNHSSAFLRKITDCVKSEALETLELWHRYIKTGIEQKISNKRAIILLKNNPKVYGSICFETLQKPFKKPKSEFQFGFSPRNSVEAQTILSLSSNYEKPWVPRLFYSCLFRLRWSVREK